MKHTRREILIGAVNAAVLAAMPPAHAQSAKRLTASTRIIEVNGKAAPVFGLIGPAGQPGITLAPGERFVVTLEK